MSHPDPNRPHEHEETEKSKARAPHAPHVDPHAPHAPSDLKQINPKLSSDIAYWSHELGISGEKLHDIIRTHGTHIEKIRHALHPHTP